MKRSRALVLLFLGVLLAACGGTYHPPTADQAIVTQGQPGTQPGAGTGAPTSGPIAGGTTSGPIVSGPTAPNVPGSSAGGGQTAVQGGVIKLGGVFPLTGPIAPIGRSYYEGLASYYSYINERGGINGARIQFLVEDDQFDPARGKALIRKLIEQDKVFAISGVLSPFTMIAALPDIRKSGTPAVPGTGTDGREYNEKLIYNTYAPCERQVQGQMEDAIKRRGSKRIALLHINIDTARQCADGAQAAISKLGATSTYRGELQAGGANCSPQVLNARTRSGGADTVFMLTDNLGVVKCVQAMNQQNWDPLVSVTANLADDQVVINALGGLAEGMHTVSPFTGINSPEYEALCGPAMNRFFPNANTQYFTIVGCTGAHLFVTAMRALGANATQASLVKYLESGVTFSTGGVSPNFSFKPNAHPGYLHMPVDLVRPLEVKGGKWVVVGPLFHGIHA
ncbi:MAG: ABC transporter substrate-binding protein [Actinomycetota bacterium]